MEYLPGYSRRWGWHTLGWGLVFLGGSVGGFRMGLPIFFPIFIGLFALDTLPLVPYFFLRSRTVVVSADGVEIRAGLRTPDTVKQRLSLNRVEAVTPVDWSVSMGKRYWAVQITTPSGAEVAVATGFPEWSEAAR